jgi:hypothetical protein
MDKPNDCISSTSKNVKKYPTKTNGKHLKEYLTWRNMLRRCSQRWLLEHPTYFGAACSDNFKSYSYFYEWCQSQVGFSNIDENGNSWQLDKDVLVKGNRLYSEDTCCFVPSKINSLFTKRNSLRGGFPLGVHFDTRDNVFKAQCCDGRSNRIHLGSFNNPADAFAAYKVYKEVLIKQVANRYKEQLDPRVYGALMNYEVHEND